MTNPPPKRNNAFEDANKGNEEFSSKDFSDLLTEYTVNGSLHGIKYLRDAKRHWVERYLKQLEFIINK